MVAAVADAPAIAITSRQRTRGLAASFSALLFTLSISACGKKTEDAPKKASATATTEQAQIEKAAADKSVRDNPVYGEQIKALDAAKEAAKAVEAQAAEAAKKIDEATK